VRRDHYEGTRLHKQLVEWIEEHVEQQWVEQMRRCAPLLIELLAEDHRRSAEELAPVVRSIVLEHCRIAETGEAGRRDQARVEGYVEKLVEELERLRRAQVEQGGWSDRSVPPQMFG